MRAESFKDVVREKARTCCLEGEYEHDKHLVDETVVEESSEIRVLVGTKLAGKGATRQF